MEIKKSSPEELCSKDLYKKGKVPFTEFLMTIFLQVSEHIFQENLNRAIYLVDLMTQISEKMRWEDHFILADVHELISQAKMKRKLKIFLANFSKR